MNGSERIPEHPTRAGVVAEALDVHRWASMGVASVKCECGEVIHGDGSLTQFPADEAFRQHIAAAVVAALDAHDTDPTIQEPPC